MLFYEVLYTVRLKRQNKIRMKRFVKKLVKKKDELDLLEEEAEKRINDLCDFEAGITFCEGDGYLIINIATSSVAGLGLLNGKTKSNKLSEDEHKKYSIQDCVQHQGMLKKGLIIRKEWLDKIFNEGKVWEMRSSCT